MDLAGFRLSADGRRVLESRFNENGGEDIWAHDVETDFSQRLTFLAGRNLYPVWSPDNRWILFASGTPLQLFRKEIDGPGSEERLVDSPHTEVPEDWSRDGRFILYRDISPDTKNDLWILPVVVNG